MKCIHRIDKPIYVEASAYNKRNSCPDRGIAKYSDSKPSTKPKPEQFKCSDHRTDPWEKAKRITHVLFLPLKLWNRNL